MQPLGALLLSGAIALLSPINALAGEKSLARLEMVSRYLDLKNEVEHRLASGETANTSLIGYLCTAYGNLKQYNKLFDCLSKLDRHIQQGDTRIGMDLPGSFVRSVDVRSLPDLLRAQAFLDFGEFQNAIASGMKARDIISSSHDRIWEGAGFLKRYLLIVDSVVAVAAVHVGDKELASRPAARQGERSDGA